MSVPEALRAIDYVRVFPWLRMGRAVGCALAIQQWLLGMIAALAGWGLSWLFPTSHAPAEPLPSTLQAFPSLVSLALYPVVSIVAPWDRLWTGRSNSVIWVTLESLAAFVLWTIAGVAVARCAAQQFCRDEGPSLRTSLQWSFQRIPTSLSSLVTPVAGLCMCAALLLVLVLPGVVSGLGTLWLQVLSPMLAALGLVMAAMAVVLPFLWPLMVTAVAVDDADSFGAFSRAFSYLTTHFWSTVLLGAIHLTAAVFVLMIVKGVFGTAEFLVAWLADFLLSEERLIALRTSITFWLRQMQYGLIFSLFWSHVTILYLFLRRAVDGTPVDSLAGYDDDMQFSEPYPVVGMPAMSPPSPSDP